MAATLSPEEQIAVGKTTLATLDVEIQAARASLRANERAVKELTVALGALVREPQARLSALRHTAFDQYLLNCRSLGYIVRQWGDGFYLSFEFHNPTTQHTTLIYVSCGTCGNRDWATIGGTLNDHGMPSDGAVCILDEDVKFQPLTDDMCVGLPQGREGVVSLVTEALAAMNKYLN
jgi:hypothetical protein